MSDTTVGFKEFVDNHVQTTTKFKSADDLLNNYKPSLRFAWICIGIFAIIGLLAAGPIGLVIFAAVLGYPISFVVAGIIRGRYSNKAAGNFNGNIDTDELLRFLNEHLGDLSPHLHEWGYMGQVGVGVRGAALTAIANSASEALKEVTLCASFGAKQKHMVTICVRPDPTNRDSGEMEYFFGAVKNGLSFELGFSRNICLFKTAPILQAAMEYYLKRIGA